MKRDFCYYIDMMRGSEIAVVEFGLYEFHFRLEGLEKNSVLATGQDMAFQTNSGEHFVVNDIVPKKYFMEAKIEMVEYSRDLMRLTLSTGVLEIYRDTNSPGGVAQLGVDGEGEFFF